MTEHDPTKERLMEMAGKVFAERGFRDATVREICQRAGANVAAVNYHFGDKERLYIESVKRAHSRRAEEVPLPQWPADAPPEARLRGFIQTFLTRLLDDPNSDWHGQLMMREMLEPSGACTELVREYIRPHFEPLQAIVREMLAADVDDQQRRLIVLGIVGQCVYFRVAAPILRLLVPPDEYSRYQPEYLADHITRSTLAVLAGFGGEPSPTRVPAVACSWPTHDAPSDDGGRP
ncbi:MAG TPA: CerR family C-terminal domain-containing protein [Pirellulales bacterium]|nr:CerR family C-terminal domain-containing protein [Pirellulales bacterium]